MQVFNNKNIISLLTLMVFSCTSDIISYDDSKSFNEDCIDWFYNLEDQSLFIQIDTKGIEHSSIDIKLSPLDLDYYTINDDGQNNDIIQDNGIYSIFIDNVPYQDNMYVLFADLKADENIISQVEYAINFNAPIIIEDSTYPVISNQHSLDDSQITYFKMIIAIDDEDGREDIDYIRFYVKKVDFYNAELVGEDCIYEQVTDQEYGFDPSWEMNYISPNLLGQFVYMVEIPMNPIQSNLECGGFGEVQIKFEVKDKKGFTDVLEYGQIVEICPGDC